MNWCLLLNMVTLLYHVIIDSVESVCRDRAYVWFSNRIIVLACHLCAVIVLDATQYDTKESLKDHNEQLLGPCRFQVPLSFHNRFLPPLVHPVLAQA